MDYQTPIDILYCDQGLVAVNKPAGLITIRDGYDIERPNLHQELSREFGRLWVVHRLDADTSGIIFFARSQEVHRSLSRQFEHHTVHKVYHLLTLGSFEWQERQVNFPLKVNGDRRHRTIVDPSAGKYAATDFRLVERLGTDFALLSASPHSGYTHQIRAHAAALGLWLLADPLYFPRLFPAEPDTLHPRRGELLQRISNLPISRTALHALSIQFEHPLTLQSFTLSAPYPEDFSAAITTLKR